MTPVHIIAKGAVGCGKSAILHEIYVALRAIGVPVEFANEDEATSERRMVDVDAALEQHLKDGLSVILHEAHSELEGA